MEREGVTKLVRVVDENGNPKPGLFTFESIKRDLDAEAEFNKFIHNEESKESQKPKNPNSNPSPVD
ncbi:MAG TPA: hypothetical protein VMR19_00615 [Candidatus Saccharimonadales bacterium]|jgi:hypothetical protein|nr:hypothetical protein [Candidatus Saccharimonadales bacterium]